MNANENGGKFSEGRIQRLYLWSNTRVEDPSRSNVHQGMVFWERGKEQTRVSREKVSLGSLLVVR